jgi:hypothetical protein
LAYPALFGEARRVPLRARGLDEASLKRARGLAAPGLAAAALAAQLAIAAPPPVLHEPIAPDPREDVAMHAVMEGNLPAALWTPSGPISGPDVRALPPPHGDVYGTRDEPASFRPDRDTRTTVNHYDDPFTPGTAPFKRMSAFDAVRSDYELYVRNRSLSAVSQGLPPRAEDDSFYMNVVVGLAPGRRARIPSVGPDTRIVSGRLGVGARDLPYAVLRDGADNWYVEALSAPGPGSARLVLELAIARTTFGGPLADLGWSELPAVSPLPPNVAHEAAQVADVIGVSRRMRPREVVSRLVAYFRSFTESAAPLSSKNSVYLDLALSKKGVCRHRAFAFMVTALQLGVPTRFVENEAHAWVEVYDGTGWRVTDLGGAGTLADVASADPGRPPYQAPGDPFPWPPGARPTLDGASPPAPLGRAPSAQSPPSTATASPVRGPNTAAPSASTREPDSEASSRIDRPSSIVALTIARDSVRRGSPLAVRGELRESGRPCENSPVDILLRSPQTKETLRLGTLATDPNGRFDGSVVLPGSAAVGDYEIIARSPGSTTCGPSRD